MVSRARELRLPRLLGLGYVIGTGEKVGRHSIEFIPTSDRVRVAAKLTSE